MRHYLNGSLRCDCANCNRKANDHDDNVDQLQEEKDKKKLSQEEEKEKKVDDIAKAQEEEEKKKKLEKDRESMMHMTDEELDNLMADIQERLDQLKKAMHLEEDEKKESKHASSSSLSLTGVGVTSLPGFRGPDSSEELSSIISIVTATKDCICSSITTSTTAPLALRGKSSMTTLVLVLGVSKKSSTSSSITSASTS